MTTRKPRSGDTTAADRSEPAPTRPRVPDAGDTDLNETDLNETNLDDTDLDEGEAWGVAGVDEKKSSEKDSASSRFAAVATALSAIVVAFIGAWALRSANSGSSGSSVPPAPVVVITVAASTAPGPTRTTQPASTASALFKFTKVPTVPFCSDLSGTGGDEGHQAVVLFIQADAGGNYYYEQPVRFVDPGGPWVARHVHIGLQSGDIGTKFDVVAFGVTEVEAGLLLNTPPNAGVRAPPGVEIERLVVTRARGEGTC